MIYPFFSVIFLLCVRILTHRDQTLNFVTTKTWYWSVFSVSCQHDLGELYAELDFFKKHRPIMVIHWDIVIRMLHEAWKTPNVYAGNDIVSITVTLSQLILFHLISATIFGHDTERRKRFKMATEPSK